MRILGPQFQLRSFISKSWSVSWPLTVIMVYEFLIGLADVYIAGKISKDVQAAYGFVIQSYFVLIVIANALTVGTVSIVSRLYSSGKKSELNRAVSSSIATSVISGFILALAGLLFSSAIIKYLNIPGELKPIAAPLIRIYALGLVFHYLLINQNGILRSCQMVKMSLKTMTLVCGLDIALNFFLSFYTSLGFMGIAAATAASVCIGSVINLVRVRNIITGVKEFSLALVKKMILIGWPIGLLQVLWQLGSMALFMILSTLPEHRIEILAALTTGLRIESVIYLPVFGFNMANAVIIGNALGEKKNEDAFRNGFVTAMIGVLIVVIMAVIVIFNARMFASFLSGDPLVINESVKYIYISMISEPFMAWGLILGGGLSGAGDTRSVLLRVAMSIWLIRLPLAYAFVAYFGFGPVSVWWSMNISQLIQALLVSERYFRRKWLFINE